ncbi:uncharacterized protein METZ01_LOCUS185159, partial [marine metagenome]
VANQDWVCDHNTASQGPVEEYQSMPNFSDDNDSGPELEGAHCDACGEWLEPGREWCPTCGMDR